MTTLQMILLGITFIIGYTFSYLLGIWREKCNNKDLRYLYEIEKKNGKYQQKEIQRLECSLREISSYIENKDDIHKGMSNMEIAKYYDRLSKDNKK